MLAGAIQQYLVAQGLTAATVFVSQFGNFTGAAQHAVAVFPDNDAEFDGAYRTRVQLRARAGNAIAADEAARLALGLLQSADGLTLVWDAPTGYTDRSYRVEAISRVNGPTWFPTAEPGEEASTNLEMFVTEV